MTVHATLDSRVPRRTTSATRSCVSTHFDCRADPDWLDHTLRQVRMDGYAVVRGVLDSHAVEHLRGAMYHVQQRIQREIGRERLARAGELGVLRLMCAYDPLFISLLELPEVLVVVDATVSPTAVMHLQNGFILPSFPPGQRPRVFQNRFHMDFPRVLNGHLCSINTLLTIDEFTEENGGTLVVPGTHQKTDPVSVEYCERHAVPAACPAGSMLVFDSTLYHAAGANVSGRDRVGINMMFTRSYFKQQIDAVRALGAETIQSLKPRTQQLLGWYTRVPSNLDEYYRPPEERLYRSHQG